MTPFPPPARALVAACLLLGLLGMFLSSFFVLKGGQTRPKTPVAADGSALEPGNTQDFIPPGGSAFSAPPDSSEAAVALMRRLRANPEDAGALAGLGEELMASGEWGQAESLLEQSLRNRPQDRRARHLLGVCLFRQRKISEAARVFEDMIRAQEDPVALYNLAILYRHHLNLPEKAEELLRRALKSPDADTDLLIRLREELSASPEAP